MPSNPFSNLFGQSPIRPIQEHIGLAHQCAEQLTVFINAVLADDWEQAEQTYQEVARLENLADDAKTQLRTNLPNSLMMPVDRSDLLVMVTQQDEIANCTKDITGIMVGRKMQIPARRRPAQKSPCAPP